MKLVGKRLNKLYVKYSKQKIDKIGKIVLLSIPFTIKDFYNIYARKPDKLCVAGLTMILQGHTQGTQFSDIAIKWFLLIEIVNGKNKEIVYMFDNIVMS